MDELTQRFLNEVTSHYRVAKLKREEEEEIKQLEDRLGVTLIAYKRR